MRSLATGITGAVSFWGTLALNIPDFTRYAKSQKDQAVGQSDQPADDHDLLRLRRRGGDQRDLHSFSTAKWSKIP